MAARNKREKMAEKYKRLHNGQLPPMSIGEKLSRKLCCCFNSEPVPGTWAEIRARQAEARSGGKKKKGKKKRGGGKKAKLDRSGSGNKQYH